MRRPRLAVRLRYDVTPEVACAYLSDPTTRPEWQSSLRRVEVIDPGAAHEGQRWEDHTAVGLVAQMETTVLEPGEVWAESGSWRGVTADLVLSFEPWGSGCEITGRMRVRGAGPLAPLGWAATLAGQPAVRSDLARAGRILSEREHP